MPTEYFEDTTRTIITRNDSPDVPFDFSVNPYRGCEHGCIYCYARPYHEYLGLSAGLDFETRIFAKLQAPELLRRELSRRSWRPTPLGLSGVTDPYQPVERSLRITRRCLEVLAAHRHPVGIITKSALVGRDLDILTSLARDDAASVAVSVTTLDGRLNDAGVPAGVMVAPVVPGLTDHEVPAILRKAADAGARFAGFITLRLPHGVGPLFEAWLERHYPDRKAKVLQHVRGVRAGRLNDSRFGTRMRGEGPMADLISRMFWVARERAGIAARGPILSSAAFRIPNATPSLFD